MLMRRGRLARRFQLHSPAGVNQYQHDVACLERLVDFLQHAPIQMRCRLVHSRRIDKNNLRRRVNLFSRIHLHHADDTVACGLRLRSDNGHFLAGERIHQRAFAGVGPTQNGNKSGFHLR